MKLAGVTVLYNPEAEVVKNIETYVDSLDVLYVIDNSESDNSSLFENGKIRYMPNHKNLGISKALNKGAGLAEADGFEWMLTMDQDSRFPSKTCLEQMKSFLDFILSEKCIPLLFGIESDNVGVVSPFHNIPTYTGDLPKGYAFSDVVMTSGNIVNLKACREIGGYNEDYFIDAVDFDFCMKMKNHGYDIISLNYIRMSHPLGDPVFKTVLGRRMYSLNHNYIRQYYIVRNRNYFVNEHKESSPAFCKAEKKRTFREAVKILLLEEDKFRKLKYMYLGYKDYKRGIKGEIPEKYKKG